MNQELMPDRLPQRSYPQQQMPMPRPVPTGPERLPPRPKHRKPDGKLTLTLAHGLIGAIITYGVELLSHQITSPGPTMLLRALSPGGYVPFSLAASCALHRQRTLVLVLVGVIMLIIYPFTMKQLADWLLPVGAGILLGSLIERMAGEARGEPTEGGTAE